MRLRISLITPALLLALGTACGEQRTNTPPPRAATPVLARDAPRCYEVHPTRDLYYVTRRLRLETTPRVDRMRGISSDSLWALTRLNAQGGAIVKEGNPILFWTTAPPDSIRIVLSTGFSGSELIVGAAGGDTLRGRGTTFWDVGPTQNDVAPVTLVRIPCVTTD